MVEAAQVGPRTHLSTPQTKRGFRCPLMLTVGNTHLVYASGDTLIFRGRNGAKDFVYTGHRAKISALGHCTGDLYAFGDVNGQVQLFKFNTANNNFELFKDVSQKLGGEVKSIEFMHESKEMQTKIIVVGDSGPGGAQAKCTKLNGMDAGTIEGSASGLLCCARTKAVDIKDKTKLFSGGETGELFLHEGAPFPGQGQVIERFQGEYINDMALDEEKNRLYLALSSKKIIVYDSETQEKIFEMHNAHSKGIYGVVLVPGSEADIATCSADNTIKTWKLNEETKELTNVTTLQQSNGAEESVSRMLMNMLCFEENGIVQTIAINLQGDLVMHSNWAPSGETTAAKDIIKNVTVAKSDGTVYYCSERNTFAMRAGVSTRVSDIPAAQKSDFSALFSNDHSVYATSPDGFVLRIVGDAVTQSAQFPDTKILDAALGNDTLYFVTQRKELIMVDANTLAETKKISLGYDGLCVTLVSNSAELWIGDNKGNMHIHSAESLEETSQFVVQAGQKIQCLTTSIDGSKVAHGNSVRHVVIWDAASKEKIQDHGHHKNKVYALQFTQDGNGIASVSDDFSLVVCDLNTKKHFQIKQCHDERVVLDIALTADKTIFTVGKDCMVREWPASETWSKIPA